MSLESWSESCRNVDGMLPDGTDRLSQLPSASSPLPSSFITIASDLACLDCGGDVQPSCDFRRFRLDAGLGVDRLAVCGRGWVDDEELDVCWLDSVSRVVSPSPRQRQSNSYTEILESLCLIVVKRRDKYRRHRRSLTCGDDNRKLWQKSRSEWSLSYVNLVDENKVLPELWHVLFWLLRYFRLGKDSNLRSSGLLSVIK